MEAVIFIVVILIIIFVVSNSNQSEPSNQSAEQGASKAKKADGAGATASTYSSIVGKWKRYQGPHDFYWTFDADGTCETDEIPGVSIAKGTYTKSGDTVIFRNASGTLDFNVNIYRKMYNKTYGDILTVIFKNGDHFSYQRIG